MSAAVVETNTQFLIRAVCDGDLHATHLVRRAWFTVAELEADLAFEAVTR